MTDQKKNEFMHKIQTAGITLTTGGIAWAIGLLIHISQALPLLQDHQDTMKQDIIEVRGSVKFLNDMQLKDEGRISSIEAGLNEQKEILSKRNFPYNH